MYVWFGLELLEFKVSNDLVDNERYWFITNINNREFLL